ncbi:MAG: polysaccharide deacetylase family protein [Hyphomicrobiaceae bacterium]
MASFEDLLAELDLYGAEGEPATLWWRDDDAIEPTDPLARMIDLAERHAVPLTIAVIPAGLKPSLAPFIAPAAMVTPVQHGFRHRNLRAAGMKAAEFGDERDGAEIASEVAEGLALVRSLPRFRPVFVPPWNRIGDNHLPILARAGLRGVSGFGARDHALPIEGFTRANTHADITAWRRDRGFLGEAKVLGDLVTHLKARRAGSAERNEPTGLLTHHLVHDQASWEFIETLLGLTREHPGVRWIDAGQVFDLAA